MEAAAAAGVAATGDGVPNGEESRQGRWASLHGRVEEGCRGRRRGRGGEGGRGRDGRRQQRWGGGAHQGLGRGRGSRRIKIWLGGVVGEGEAGGEGFGTDGRGAAGGGGGVEPVG